MKDCLKKIEEEEVVFGLFSSRIKKSSQNDLAKTARKVITECDASIYREMLITTYRPEVNPKTSLSVASRIFGTPILFSLKFRSSSALRKNITLGNVV